MLMAEDSPWRCGLWRLDWFFGDVSHVDGQTAVVESQRSSIMQ